jgi:hypothetical protein
VGGEIWYFIAYYVSSAEMELMSQPGSGLVSFWKGLRRWLGLGGGIVEILFYIL